MFRRAEPGECRPVKLDLLTPGELFEIERRRDRSKGQPVGFCHAVDVIGRDDGAGARHVLHDGVRTSRDMFTDVAGGGGGPVVVAVAPARDDTPVLTLSPT